jgi:hypothetical protein
MSTTHIRDGLDVTRSEVGSVVVASILGSIAFGIVMSLTLGNVLLTAIPGMYGMAGVDPMTGLFVGWAIHISHGTALGLAFGTAVTLVPKCGSDLRYGLAAGLMYGALLWLTLATVLMPFWVGITTPMAPPVPDPQPWSFVGHLIYGGYLGLLIPMYRRYE